MQILENPDNFGDLAEHARIIVSFLSEALQEMEDR